MQRLVVIGKTIPTDRILKLSKTLGGRIALARHAAELTQWDLAEKVHVSQSLISLWERDRVAPDADAIKRVAKAVKATQSYLTTDPVVADGEAA